MTTGDRVRILPHTDLYMRGEHFGTITKVGRKWIHVHGTRSGLTFKLAPSSIEVIQPNEYKSAGARLLSSVMERTAA